jgi:hypothetical protein
VKDAFCPEVVKIDIAVIGNNERNLKWVSSTRMMTLAPSKDLARTDSRKRSSLRSRLTQGHSKTTSEISQIDAMDWNDSTHALFSFGGCCGGGGGGVANWLCFARRLIALAFEVDMALVLVNDTVA